MLYFILKVLISAVLIAAISEISQRSTLAGAVHPARAPWGDEPKLIQKHMFA